MKKVISIITLSILINNVAFCQDRQTLVGNKIKKVGLVAGLNGGYSSLNSSFLPGASSYAGLVFNERFILGLSSQGFSTQKRTVGSISNRSGMGGLYLEYILTPHKPVHVSFPLIVGAGRASTDTVTSSGFDGRHKGRKGHGRGGFYGSSNGTEFGFIQPGINLEFNVLKNISLVAGLNYRIGFGATGGTLGNSDLSSIGLNAGLRAGIYNIHKPKGIKHRKNGNFRRERKEQN